MSVRSGALNLFRENSHSQQTADIQKALKKSDILSLSEVHGSAVKQWAKQHGYVFVDGPDDTAIIGKPDVIRLVPGTEGAEKLNDLEGERGAARSRHAVYAQFELVANGKKFWQISAHTVPRGKKGMNPQRRAIAKEQYQTLARLAKRLDGPVLVAGDLNNVDPNVKGFESGHDGGIMHVMGHGASTVDLDKIGSQKLNSDHSAAFSTYRLDGGGHDKVDLRGEDLSGKGAGAGRRRNRGVGKQDTNTVADFAADYGWAKSFIQDNPQLSEVFDKAIENSWSPQRFIAEIQDTPWFKKHSDTWRQSVYLQATDPKTYEQRVNQIRGQVADAAGHLGIEVSPHLLDQWAERAVRFGWTDAQINNHLASQVKVMGENTVGGELATTQNNLKQFAYQNGVNINDKTMQNWLRSIVRGTSTMQEYQQYVTKMAVAAHPNWRKELEGGMTLADIAQPYQNTMAQLLEIDPAKIDPHDKMIRRALSMKNDKGEYKSMALYDFEDMVRQDPRWQKTDNAKQQYMDTGSAILKMFGLST